MTYIALASLLLGLLVLPAHAGMGPLNMDSYVQTIQIRFVNEAAAQRASLNIAPLYHDLEAALSSRWDDNHLDDLRVSQVMDRYGQKGTFYWNNPKGWYGASEAGVSITGDVATELSKIVLKSGHSIGGHTLSHEFLPSLSRNRMFKEIMGLRVEQEAAAQTPVMSFTYPFVAFKAELGDGTDRKDIEEALRRAGFYQLAENYYNGEYDSGLFDGVFFAADGQENVWGVNVQREMTRKREPADRPLFLVTMHPWARSWGGPEFPKLAAMYEKWGHNSDWWYCTQNQYGAYRYQFRYASLKTTVEGRTVTATLERPDIRDLNDPAPLSLLVAGISKSDVEAIACATADVQPFDVSRDGGVYAFDLPHDRGRQMPQAYGRVENAQNAADTAGASAAPQIPDVKALLSLQGNALSLVLRNESDYPLRDIRVAFRLPLRWADGVKRVPVRDLAPGEQEVVRVELKPATGEFAYTSDTEYHVAQVDFVGQKPCRLLATCAVKGVEQDSSYPRDGFVVLGPLPQDRSDFDCAAFADSILKAPTPQRSYALPFADQRVAWTAPSIQQTSFLDPGIIWTTGQSTDLAQSSRDPSGRYPHGKKLSFLLWGKVSSRTARVVHAVCVAECAQRIVVNGQDARGQDIPLNQGENDIRILYCPNPRSWSGFSPRAYGMQLRLTDEKGARVSDLVFGRPELAD